MTTYGLFKDLDLEFLDQCTQKEERSSTDLKTQEIKKKLDDHQK
jgi:hypothetical protein